jgi:hypothetical protein
MGAGGILEILFYFVCSPSISNKTAIFFNGTSRIG